MIYTTNMIEVFQMGDGEWVAKTHVTFFSSKGKRDEVFGDVSTYCLFNSITKAIDALLETLKGSGVKLKEDYFLAYTYMGKEDQENPPISKNWKEIIISEAESRNWEAFVGV